MSEAPVIAAFDLATVTGVCVGRAGIKNPTLATWDFREFNPRPARFYEFFVRAHNLFAMAHKAGAPVTQVRYEAPMTLGAMNKVGASEATVGLLRGIVGVLEACAWRAGIRDITSISVHAARNHLIGTNRKGGKAEVIRWCRMLGYPVEDDNQADAVALWSRASALANPRIAHLSTPLFAAR